MPESEIMFCGLIDSLDELIACDLSGIFSFENDTRWKQMLQKLVHHIGK